MGPRQLRKELTRERVLGAARDLFEEVGYEAAAIREIARRAGVSVGSVFTSFEGKADLLSQVMNDRLESLYAELDHVAPHLRGSTADRLRSVMAVHYDFEMRRQRLFIAYISASFAWTPTQAVTPLGRNQRLRGMLEDIVRQGVERGEVRADADIAVFIDAILANYIWNYRLVSHDGATGPDLIALMDRQVGTLFEGVAARPGPAA